jgi:hypothetical protein
MKSGLLIFLLDNGDVDYVSILGLSLLFFSFNHWISEDSFGDHHWNYHLHMSEELIFGHLRCFATHPERLATLLANYLYNVRKTIMLLNETTTSRGTRKTKLEVDYKHRTMVFNGNSYHHRLDNFLIPRKWLMKSHFEQ